MWEGDARTDPVARPGPSVRVFGDVGVDDGNGPLSIGGPKQRRLLALLVIQPGSTVRVDRLAEYLWDDSDRPDTTVPALRTYVSRLRAALPDDIQGWIETEQGGYRFAGPPEAVEHRRFSLLRDDATAARERNDPMAALGFLDEALALWRGEPFRELEDFDWARADIEQLTLDRLEMLEERWEVALALGRHTQITGELAVFTAEHRLRDRAARQLALALHRSGRTPEALRVVADHRRVLADETGLDPSPAIVELESALFAGDPSLLVEKVGRPLRGYRLAEEIGRGAFSVVWRGTQPSVDREVAIKQIRSELACQPEFIRRFEAEARLVARIEHPHIVPLIDYWRDPDSAYLVMRWLRGGTLERRLDDGPLGLEQTMTMATQIGGALTSAHSYGVVHRDVKTANILFDEQGNSFLTDFGIALEATQSGGPEAALSQGSPAYAAPEQIRREQLGPEADVFSLAVVVFECLTGSLPFSGPSPTHDLVDRQLNEAYPLLTDVVADIPEPLAAAIVKATAKEPVDRFASIDEFLIALSLDSPPTQLDPGASQWQRPGEQAVPPTEIENPYMGLRAFDDGDIDQFFGRESLVSEIVGRLSGQSIASRCVVLVGPSGSGKSSVVRAGLTPALRAGAGPSSADWFFTTMVPGPDPFESLEAALLCIAVNPPSSLIGQLRDGKRGLLRSVRRCLTADDHRVLLVIDQFEEIFTGRSAQDAHDFLDVLSVAIEDPSTPLRVVITLRADYFHRVLEHPSFARIVDDAAVNVRPLAPDELERAIVEPARRVGVTFEPGLVARLSSETIGQPSPLPLLQYALSELFDHRDGHEMTVAAHDALGGLSGSLATRADALHAAADSEGRAAIRRVFGRLTSPDQESADLRRRVPLADFTGDSASEAAIREYGAARLLSFDRDGATREPTVEVAHEALLREWPRLVEWLNEDRDVLRTTDAIAFAANTWDDGGRQAADLSRGARLESAIDVATTTPARLRDLDDDFIAASRTAADRERHTERRRVRRLRSLVIGTAAALVVALAAGAVAVRRGNEASEAAVQAEYAALVSRSAEASDPSVGLLLALEADRRLPGAESNAAILAALAETSGGRRVASFDPLAENNCGFAGAVSDDGLMQTSVANGAMVMRDLTTGEVTDHGQIPQDCAWWFGDATADRRWARSESGDRLWLGPLDGPWNIELELDVPAFPKWLSTMRTNRLVLEEVDEAAVGFRLIDATNGDTIGAPLSGFVDPIDATSSVTGDVVVFSLSQPEDAGTVIIAVDSESGAELSRTELDREVQELVFDDANRQVVAVTQSGRLITIDVDNGSIVAETDIGLSTVYDLGVQADGLIAVISTTSFVSPGKIEVFDRRNGLVGSTLELQEIQGGVVRSDGKILTWPTTFRVDVLDLSAGALVEKTWDIEATDDGGFGHRMFVSPESSADDSDASILDLIDGQRTSVSLVPPAGVDHPLAAALPQADGLLAVSLDGGVALWSNGQLTERIDTTGDQPFETMNGHTTLGRLALLAGGPGDPIEPDFRAEAYLINTLPGELEVFLSIPVENAAGVLPTPSDGLHVIDVFGRVRTYNSSGEFVDELETRLRSPSFFEIDPSTGRLAVGSLQGVVVVDPETRAITTVETSGFVEAVSFVSSGEVLAMAGADGTVRLWDVEQEMSLGELWDAGEPIRALWHDPESASLWVWLERQLVELTVDPEIWKTRACENAGRDLTPEEWDLLVPSRGEAQSACS